MFHSGHPTVLSLARSLNWVPEPWRPADKQERYSSTIEIRMDSFLDDGISPATQLVRSRSKRKLVFLWPMVEELSRRWPQHVKLMTCKSASKVCLALFWNLFKLYTKHLFIYIQYVLCTHKILLYYFTSLYSLFTANSWHELTIYKSVVAY